MISCVGPATTISSKTDRKYEPYELVQSQACASRKPGSSAPKKASEKALFRDTLRDVLKDAPCTAGAPSEHPRPAEAATVSLRRD
jgi:hypothetical protein